MNSEGSSGRDSPFTATSTTHKVELGPIRQAYALVVGPHRGRWLALTALAVVVSAVETLGAALIYVLIGLVTDPDGSVELPIFGDIRDLLPELETETLLIGAAVAIGLFFVVRGILQVVQTYAQHRVAYNAGVRLGVRLVKGYLAMPYAYHLRHDSAELVRNATASVQETVNKVVLQATRFLAEILIVIGMTGLLVATAPAASLLVIVVVVPAVYIVLRLVKVRAKRYGRIAVESARGTLQTLQQGLHGIRDVRLLEREQFFVNLFRRHRQRDAEARARQATFSQLTSVLIETLLVVSIVVFLVVTVSTVGTTGQTFAILGLFAYVSMRLKPSIQKMISAANNLRFATPAIDDLHQDMVETADAIRSTNDISDLPRLTDSIELTDVVFYYDGEEDPALELTALKVGANESVGICGPTGGGKSTLVDLIAGLLMPTAGEVTVDGFNIHENVRSWHRQLGVVSQNVYLFDETLRHNIALGVPDKEIDEIALQKAVEVAQLGGFVAGLPKGLDSRVGEHGTLLSGGQRQRLAIARALYRNPSVLILDEGTSALDNETEREFINALERFHGEKTIVLVAHRLSTIRQCDKIVFVNHGHVSGIGTYDELYAEHPDFRRLAV